MIKQDEVYRIGALGKPHGVKGEITFNFTDDIFDRTDECNYLVCMIDGILVPFFIEEYRFKGDTVALIKFEGINTAEQVRKYSNTEVYFPVKYADDAEAGEVSWDYFVGFGVTDKRHGFLGKIEEVDNATINTLFIIHRLDGSELLIPAQEAFITAINHKKRTIQMHLPDGMVDVE